MKNEILRFQNMKFSIKGRSYGPFFIQLFEEKLTGIFVDEFFEKEILEELFCGKVQQIEGSLYLRERLITAEEQMSQLKKINIEEISLISGRSRLFNTFSVAENIFFPHFLIKTNRMDKVVREMFQFFQLEFSSSTKVEQLTVLERIQVEILRAVVGKRKILIVSDVNKFLTRENICSLNRIYKQLVQMGYTVCIIESPTKITMEILDYFTLIQDGKTVGYGAKGEYSYMEAYRLLSYPQHTDKYKDFLKVRAPQFYKKGEGIILEWDGVTSKKNTNISFLIKPGEIIEIICKKHFVYEDLVEILKGNNKPVSGKICFNGKDVSAQDLKKDLKQWRIGYIDTSEAILFTNKTIIENICYPLSLKIPFFYLGKKYVKAVKDYIQEKVKEMDLQVEVSKLSFEQTIWVWICKWLVCKPQLLLFFVPNTIGMDKLDSVIEKLFIELVLQDVAILIVTEGHEIVSEIISREIIL